jgi:hypothetical protein
MGLYDYETALFAYLENLKHQLNYKPLSLGGVSGENGGGGGPAGGFIGMLPQSRVAYDSVEAAVYTTASGIANMTRTLYPVYNAWDTDWYLLPTYDPYEWAENITIPIDTSEHTLIETIGTAKDSTSGISAGTWTFSTQWIVSRATSAGIPASGWSCNVQAYVDRYTVASGWASLFNVRTNTIVSDGTYESTLPNQIVTSVQPAFGMQPDDLLRISYKATQVVTDSESIVFRPDLVEGLAGPTGLPVGAGKLFSVQLPTSIMVGWTPEDAPNGIIDGGNYQPLVLGGSSLVDNLNHIRGRLVNLEQNLNQAIFTFEGEASVLSSPIRIYNFIKNRKLMEICVSAGIAPTGNSIIVDIHKNGTTIFTDQSHRPVISAGNNYGNTQIIDVSSWNINDYLTAHIDQVGSSETGEYVVVYVIYK